MTKRIALIAIFSSLFIFACSDTSDSQSSKADTSVDPTPTTTKEKNASVNKKEATATPPKSSDTRETDKPQLSTKETTTTDATIKENTTETNAVEAQENTAVEETTVEKGTLLFFMNPNGGPCIAQNKIITSILDKLEEKVDVVYIKTDDPISRMTFNRYGVRRLPSIIVLNSAGDMHKQLPPGIHQENILLDAVSF